MICRSCTGKAYHVKRAQSTDVYTVARTYLWLEKDEAEDAAKVRQVPGAELAHEAVEVRHEGQAEGVDAHGQHLQV
jgi:hypothetical protein